ncbi:DNA repair protein RecN [Chitinophaga sp. XS-30]|uniref:DNA repair protein RecN n=1 Tax=Chitinophaga sp. XS-30 TaxID=2604421 RepID=UPI0011DDCF4F|nr:DNA repair protein RecN [Chitinophaga sp. XS-30]QEH43647.1 DNA repair protein RecN [Chitinophaga sp. XS-30]
MLYRLIIQNYAIIDHLEIDFAGNLNVITGETGAGKSILLGALSLILGERADPGVLFDKSRKCVIEGIFKVKKKQVQAFFEEHELDLDEQVILRREISAAGKSRAFINDTPVNLAQLSALSLMLVDLHQQFDTLELEKSGFQREVVDALAAHQDQLSAYTRRFHEYARLQRELKELLQQRDHANRESDYNKFLLDELLEADLKEGEMESLEAEQQALSHSEEIKGTLTRIYFQLKEDEQPVLQQLRQLQASLQTLSGFHREVPALAERMQSSYLELQDIAAEIERLNDGLQYDGEKMEQLNERLTQLYKLQKKHNVQKTEELLAIRDQLQAALDNVLNLDERLVALEEQIAGLEAVLQQEAVLISQQRQAQLLPFEEKVNALLAQVGMPNARIKVDLRQAPLHAHGQDAIEFLFDANKSNQFAPIRKVASGGELSRLMLCIKSLVARSVALPTLIFDEIDTGISGEAAKQVGIIMKELARGHQVICITHQPQLAGKADAHYFVYKQMEGEKVSTHVRLLTQDERITAIARMLGGEKPTAAAMENAREMVAQ